jgi:protocatechuate 3,4-dioxygenase beta subunit
MQPRLGARRLRVLGTVTALVVGTVLGTAASAHATVPDASISLSGVVRAADGGAPVSGVKVEVFSEDNSDLDPDFLDYTQSLSPLATGTTDATGAYTLSGALLPYEAYQVCFVTDGASGAPTGYVQRCYGDDASDKHTQAGQPVVFEPAQHRTGFNTTLQVGAQLSGTVTDAAGQPLRHVAVGLGSSFFSAVEAGFFAIGETSNGDGVFYSGGDGEGMVNTNAAGHYTLKGIAPGPWTTLNFDPSEATGGDSSTGYLDELYDHASSRATPIALSAGQHVKISTKLAAAPPAPSGTIAGTVRDAKGTAINGAIVEVSYSTGVLPQSFPGVLDATTDSAGHYSVTGLPDGGYSVCVTPRHASTAGAQVGCHAPTNVKIAHGDTRTGIDVVSVVGAQISGHVTDGLSRGLGGVLVQASTAQGGAEEFGDYDPDTDYIDETTLTSASGAYRLTGLPAGDYDLCFTAASAVGPSKYGYAGQCYDKTVLNSDVADAVGVTLGQHLTINAALTDLSTLPAVSGRVSDIEGSPVGDVSIEIRSTHGSGTAEGYDNTNIITAPDGRYSAQGIPSGTYYVCAYGGDSQGGSSKGGYVNACGKSGQLTITVAKKSIKGIDFTLAATGSISGVVTDASGTPVPAADVQVFSAATKSELQDVTSRADGSYDLAGLSKGIYRICVDPSVASQLEGPSTGFAPACDGNLAWNLTAHPTPDITVTAGADTAIAPIKLGLGTAITGHVTGSGGAPLAGVGVAIVASNADNSSYEEPQTAADGSYLVSGLIPGTKYDVCFDAENGIAGPSSTGYTGICNGGVPFSEFEGANEGTPVKTGAGGSTSTVNAKLPAAAAISGKVVDTDGSAVAGASVVLTMTFADGSEQSSPVQTYDDGTYTVTGLAAGAYSICFQAGSSKHNVALGLVGQCYKDKSLLTTHPTLLKVKLGQHYAKINGTESFAGGVSGTVVDQNGAPAAGVIVIAGLGGLQSLDGDNTPVAAVTDSLGNYTVTGVTPGKKVTACFLSPDSQSQFTGSCYKNKSIETSSPTTFTVVAGKVTAGIDGKVKL